MSQC